MNNLPEPVTVSEMYQAAILAELKAIHEVLNRMESLQPARGAAPAGTVELREAMKKAER